MIKVQIRPNALDPTQRVANLLALVFRELAVEKKRSAVIEVHTKPEDPPVRLQLRLLAPKISQGASWREPPRKTRSKGST